MTETPDRSEALFAAALALANVAERVAYLDQACSGDTALRGHVEALLRAHERAGHLLDRPVPGGQEQTGAYLSNEQSGTHMAHEQQGTVIAGRYKLLEQIGEGGMGAVWVAEQSQPVKRKVALKLIKAGMDSKSILARFEVERQALAVMDHPNITKVLDGGLTETGRSYFVMEYVKGVPITEYCDATRMSVSERLNLFVQVCSAVQHAHQKGIIHRDLKPSNILVAPYDDKPVPKVIDFGLAKAMHQSLTERTLHTAHETVLGTPLYMSPEQAQLNNLDVDTRSDIYSLGVLLYELLTGTTPVEKKRFKEAAWDEMKRLIREEDPPRPSTRLSSTNTLPSLAAGRQIDPAKLTKLVRGELDCIVMKSLEKDRTRRYETAHGFAMDIQRYLAGEPVLAAPPSARYRLRKFARKHRVAMMITATIALVLVAGGAVSTWQAIRATWAERQMRIALDEAQHARTEKENALHESEEARQQAEAVTKYLVKLFRSTDPRVDGRDLKISELLDRAPSDLDANFADRPKLKGDLLFTLGQTYEGLRLYKKAAELYEKAQALREVTLGPVHRDTLNAMGSLARTYRAAGRFDEAIHLREESLRLQLAKLGPDHPDTLHATSILGETYQWASRPADAIRLLEPALKLCQSKLPPNDPVTLSVMKNLALAYLVGKRLPEAVSLFEEAIKLMRVKLGTDDAETLDTTNNLARAFLATHRPELAIRLLEESLPSYKTKLGLYDGRTVGAISYLGEAYDATDQAAKAGPLFVELVTSMRQKVSHESDLALSLVLLGHHHLLQMKYTEAEPILRECLAIREKREPDVWTTYNTKSLLGEALVGQKNYAEAEPLLLAGYHGMKQREKTIPPNGKTRIPEAIERLVQLYEATDKKDEADKWRKELDAIKSAEMSLITNTFTEWYAAFSAEWKKKFEPWNGEMVALMAEARTK